MDDRATRYARATAVGQPVGSFYNDGCGGTGGNAGSEAATQAADAGGYFDYCCCALQ